MSEPNFAELVRAGWLSMQFQCPGCGETWTTPTARYDLRLTVPRFKRAHFCPFCRYDEVAFNFVLPPARGAARRYPKTR